MPVNEINAWLVDGSARVRTSGGEFSVLRRDHIKAAGSCPIDYLCAALGS